MVKIALVAALIGLAACQTPQGSFCSVADQYRPSQTAIDAMTDSEVEKALAALEKGRKLCGWRP